MHRDINGNWQFDPVEIEANNPTPKPSYLAARVPFHLPPSPTPPWIGGGILAFLLIVFLVSHLFGLTSTKALAGHLCTENGSVSAEVAIADTIYSLQHTTLTKAALCYYPPERNVLTALSASFDASGAKVTFTGSFIPGVSHPQSFSGEPKGTTMESIPFTGNFQECVTLPASTATTPPRKASTSCKAFQPTTYKKPNNNVLVISEGHGWFLLPVAPS